MVSRIDEVYKMLVENYAYNFPMPLQRLNADIVAIQEQGKSHEQATLELALGMGLKPAEYLALLRKGESEEQAIAEFLKGEVLSLSDSDQEVKDVIADVNWHKVTESWTTTKHKKKPSKAMYLIPLLFSILGGLIGYFAVKNTNEVMADRLLFVGMVMFCLNLLCLWMLF